MSARVFLFLCRFVPIKRLLWRWWYDFLAGLHRTGDWFFMNYGYAAFPADPIALDSSDKSNLYSVQLYHAVVNGVNLANLRALQIGSGRGALSGSGHAQSHCGLNELMRMLSCKTSYLAKTDPLRCSSEVEPVGQDDAGKT